MPRSPTPARSGSRTFESTLKNTVADYDRLIASREDDIYRLNDELAAVKLEFAGELRLMGLDLGDDQIEPPLLTVVTIRTTSASCLTTSRSSPVSSRCWSPECAYPAERAMLLRAHVPLVFRRSTACTRGGD